MTDTVAHVLCKGFSKNLRLCKSIHFLQKSPFSEILGEQNLNFSENIWFFTCRVNRQFHRCIVAKYTLSLRQIGEGETSLWKSPISRNEKFWPHFRVSMTSVGVLKKLRRSSKHEYVVRTAHFSSLDFFKARPPGRNFFQSCPFLVNPSRFLWCFFNSFDENLWIVTSEIGKMIVFLVNPSRQWAHFSTFWLI